MRDVIAAILLILTAVYFGIAVAPDLLYIGKLSPSSVAWANRTYNHPKL